MSADREPIAYANVLIPILLTVFALDVLCALSAGASGNWFLVASLVSVGGLTVVATRVLRARR